MGTRGMIGIQADGNLVGTYNHYDSYPTYLGVEVAGQALALEQDKERVAQRVAALRLVDETAQPSEEDRLRYAETQQEVSTGRDWYSLLRGMQGDLPAYLAAGVMPDGLGFARDSLFCEWAYIVNLDEGTLEVYKGFQDKPHDKGRFADNPLPANKERLRYYPVALVRTLPLDVLRASNLDEVMLEIEKTETERDEAEYAASKD